MVRFNFRCPFVGGIDAKKKSKGGPKNLPPYRFRCQILGPLLGLKNFNHDNI